MTSYTNLTNVSHEPITLERMAKIMDDLEAKFPKSERCKRIECDLTSLFGIKAACATATDKPSGSLYGMPIIPRFDVPESTWIEVMADGSSVAHYPTGYKVRCLPDKEPEPEWLSKPVDFEEIRFRAYMRW